MIKRLTITVSTEQLERLRSARRTVLNTKLRDGESLMAYIERQQAARDAEYVAMLVLQSAVLNADEVDREERARRLGMDNAAIEATRQLMRAANEAE